MKTKARPNEKMNVTLEEDANLKEMYVVDTGMYSTGSRYILRIP